MRKWTARALLILLVLPSRAVTAQEREGEVQASDRAVQLGHSALQKYQRHAWQEAYAELEAAERLAHSPVFALYMARCERELGHLLASKALYEAVLEETLLPDAPQAFHEAQLAARAELLELRAKVSSVVLSTKPGLPTLAPELIRVEVREATRSRRAAAPSAAPDPRTQSTHWAPLIGFAVGATGLLVGAVSGVVAWSEMRKLRADCPGDACRPGDQHRRDNVRALADVSTIGFVAGGLGIGAGLTLMVALPASRPVNGVRGPTPVAALSLQGEL